MTPRGRGTILFTGATASVRGGAGFAAFASAKHGAAGGGPEHGPRTGPQGRPRGPHDHRRGHRHPLDRRELPRALRPEGQDGILNPDHIADAYWALHVQPRDAWTHELDLRPWMETW